MMKKILIIGAIIVVCFIAGYFLLLQQASTQPAKELKLSDFPEVFKEDTAIVIGENASQIEKESAEAIAANLENLTGKKPEIILSKNIEKFKYNFNLIIVGMPKTNPFLEEVYQMTNATRVTEEYPGEGKGILEILRSPWNEDKAMLLVEGSDEWGVKAGGEIVVKGIKTDEKILVIGGISREEAIEIAKNDDHVKIYLKNYPDHKLVKVILLKTKTNDKPTLYWDVHWDLGVQRDPQTIPHGADLFVSIDATTGEVLGIWVPE